MQIGTIVYIVDDDNPEEHLIRRAAKILQEGGTVCFPTETVYGLGANALDENSVEKIYKAKGRPSDNPLIVHVHDKNQVEEIAKDITYNAKLLMDKFWPGPLTMVFKKKDIVPLKVTGGLDTVAVRIPSNKIALSLLRESNIMVAAPSANISGKTSPTSASHVIRDLLGRVDSIIAAGDTSVGLESTVIDMTGEVPTILRPGGITLEEIKEVIGEVMVDRPRDDKDKDFVPKAPGMKYVHYSPEAKFVLFMGSVENMTENIRLRAKEEIAKGNRVGIMTTTENQQSYMDIREAVVMPAGSRNNPYSIGREIFRTLRHFDDKKVDIILAEGTEESSIGVAVMNRLKKAAGENVVKV